MSRLDSYFVGGGKYSVAGRAHSCALSIDNYFTLRGGVFSRQPDRNAESYKFYNVQESCLFDSFDHLLEFLSKRSKSSALHILTDTPSHPELIINALKSGCNVISEKPLCSSLGEFNAIVTELNQSSGNLYVTFNYNGYPMIRQLKDFLNNGLLGDILYIKSTMSQQTFIRCGISDDFSPPQAWRQHDGVNSMLHLDLFSHQFELTRYITGLKPMSISESSHSLSPYMSCVDLSQIHITYEGSIPGFYSFDKVSLGNENGLTWSVYGTLGSLHWKQENPEKLEFNNRLGEKTIYTRQSPKCTIASQQRYSRFKPGHPAGYIEAFANVYRDIYSSIATGIRHDEITPIEELGDFYRVLQAGRASMNSSNSIIGLSYV